MAEQFKIWWAGLSDREQQLSLLSIVFLLLATVYWGAWKPLANHLQESEKQLNNAQQTLTWVEEKVPLLLQASSFTGGDEKQSPLIQIVTSSAKQYAINFSRVENKEQQVELWIADVEFDLLLRWLTDLKNQHLISVISTDISKIERQGHIKVNRLILKR